MNEFLPISPAEMQERGWYYCDFLLVTGDAYVDHPSFGTAIISRVLEDAGYRVAILSQPDFHSDADFRAMGRPRYAVLINSGNIDSMVAHYTAAKKRRSEDAYTPGGVAGKRPDRAVTVYAMLARRAFPDTPIYLGGIEASLRRFAHYDYWANRVMPSLLDTTGADGLMYGMGERSVLELAEQLKHGKKGAEACVAVRGMAYLTTVPMSARTSVASATTATTRSAVTATTAATAPFTEPALSIELPFPAVECPSYEAVLTDKPEYARSVQMQYDEQDAHTGRAVLQRHGKRVLVQNPPSLPLSTAEMDHVYALPYQRTYHPSYEALGGVPAIQEVQFSIIHNRGCFGGCNFCALAFHQGRFIQSRSHESVLAEARQIIAMPGFKGYIHDVGGPTANFRFPACPKQEQHGLCRDKRCLFPQACAQLQADHSDYLELLRQLRRLPGVKKVFVRSGLRYDYMMADHNDTFFLELIQHHISGQLKVAPEHISDTVLSYMGKPSFAVYEQFRARYTRLNQKLGKKQYLVPYLMSSHPGATLREAVALAEYLNRIGYMPEQVQDFYPTPGTLSTAMYYTGLDPRTMQPVYVAKTAEEKAMQRALLQWRKPEKRALVCAALRKAGRLDLIGWDKHCLIRPGRDTQATGVPPIAGATAAKTRIARQSPSRSQSQSRQRQPPASRTAAKPPHPTRKAGWAKAKPKPKSPAHKRSKP